MKRDGHSTGLKVHEMERKAPGNAHADDETSINKSVMASLLRKKVSEGKGEKQD